MIKKLIAFSFVFPLTAFAADYNNIESCISTKIVPKNKFEEIRKSNKSSDTIANEILDKCMPLLDKEYYISGNLSQEDKEKLIKMKKEMIEKYRKSEHDMLVTYINGIRKNPN